MQESQELNYSESTEHGTATLELKDDELDEELLRNAFQEIQKEQIKNRERIEVYKLALPLLYKGLSSEERIKFLEHPVDFCSEEILFRGLPYQQVIKLLETKEMLPQAGAFASDAVFTTNSPFAATDFIGTHGGLITIDRSRVSLMSSHGIYDAESPDFLETVNEGLVRLAQHARNRDFFYTIMNHYDTSERITLNRPWRTIALRKKQPLEVVRTLIIIDSKSDTAQDFNLDHVKPEEILATLNASHR